MGLLVVLGIQILQVVIAFIPGEPVEIFSGALYGTVGGLLICLSGCMIASTIIFALSKRYGKPLFYSLFSKEKVQGWKWLQDSRKCSMVTFILFLIPGTPKDMLTYIVGLEIYRHIHVCPYSLCPFLNNYWLNYAAGGMESFSDCIFSHGDYRDSWDWL
mgnify:CR=1 FL=1